MTTIDLQRWSKVNTWPLPSGEMAVRPGVRKLYTPDSGRELVAGFTVDNPYANDQWHYIFDVATTGRLDLKLRVLDSDLEVVQILSINADIKPRVITWAEVEGQLMIGGPDIPTLWGLVGSMVTIATKVESDNPSTSAIEVPRGICCRWSNRVVIADGRSLFISDPVAASGGSPRTFVAPNQNQRPGIVYGLHEGAGGKLICVTSTGTWALDSSAAAVGIVGSNGTAWEVLNHHPSISYASSCVHRGRVYALSRNGWLPVDTETVEEKLLTQPVMPRALGKRVSLADYRACRMLVGYDGPMVASSDLDMLYCYDVVDGHASWWTWGEAMGVCGTLEEADGTLCLVGANGVYRVDGDFDGAAGLDSAISTQPTGIVLGTIADSPAKNHYPERVTVAAAIGGVGTLSCAVRGESVTGTPPVDPQGLTIGTDSWGQANKRHTTTVLAPISFHHTVRTRSVDTAIEIGVTGCMARIAPSIEVDFGKSAENRAVSVR